MEVNKRSTVKNHMDSSFLGIMHKDLNQRGMQTRPPPPPKPTAITCDECVED